MQTTRAWAKSHGISVALTPPAIKGYSRKYPRTSRAIAVRAIVLQGVVAVAFDVNPDPVIDWFHKQRIWRAVTSDEKAFLQNRSPSKEERSNFAWHQEAGWTLLWVIGKVDWLGLPIGCCDTRRLVDEIIPPLGSNIEEFVASADLRPPGVLLAEDDRMYNLWCYAQGARRKGKPLPKDLNMAVLYERRYAFEWLDGMEDWDEVTCDA